MRGGDGPGPELGGGSATVREFAAKLRVTAAGLGCASQKDLCAQFHRVNPGTTFDLGRSYKWMQGRALPRSATLYEDWALLLGTERPPAYLQSCTLDEFLDLARDRFGLSREAPVARAGLDVAPRPEMAEQRLRRAEAFGGAPGSQDANGQALGLVGTYACYSQGWSPYFRGRLVRDALSLALPPSGPQRLLASYLEVLPTGPIRFDGTVTVTERGLGLDLRASQGGGVQLLFCLFAPTPPASVLGGLVSGLTIIAAEPEPTVTRIAMVRLPASSARLETVDAILPPGASLAADLAALGFAMDAPDLVDRTLASFLTGGPGGGIDQPPRAAYLAMVELFDRQWLDRRPRSGEAARLLARSCSSRARAREGSGQI